MSRLVARPHGHEPGLMTTEDLAERRRRRAELLEQRAAAASWRDRLLARRKKYVKAHLDLAHRISQSA
jgi:hypothetical protein